MPQYLAKPLAEKISDMFDLGIALALAAWDPLTMAVDNEWGGSESEGIREWLGGVISDLFAEEPETDHLDIETVALQVMEDEFNVRLEDQSELGLSNEIMKFREETLRGDFTRVEEMNKRWIEKQRRGKAMVKVLDQDEEEVDEEEQSDDGDGDVSMGEAPELVTVKEKPEPEVDEEGFTKVVRKKG